MEAQTEPTPTTPERDATAPADAETAGGMVPRTRVPRWRSRLLVTSSPTQLLGGAVPAPFQDVPRRPLIPPDIDDPHLSS